MTKPRPLKLRRASAYYRLAAKAERASNYRQASIYRDIADRLVESNRRDTERARQRRS